MNTNVCVDQGVCLPQSLLLLSFVVMNANTVLVDSSRSKQDHSDGSRGRGTSSKTIRCPFFSPCGLPDGVFVTAKSFSSAHYTHAWSTNNGILVFCFWRNENRKKLICQKYSKMWFRLSFKNEPDPVVWKTAFLFPRNVAVWRMFQIIEEDTREHFCYDFMTVGIQNNTR